MPGIFAAVWHDFPATLFLLGILQDPFCPRTALGQSVGMGSGGELQHKSQLPFVLRF